MAQIKNVDLKVVGVTFTNEGTGEKRREIIMELASRFKDKESEIKIELKREPENMYDANAVMVLADGKQIGYIWQGICGNYRTHDGRLRGILGYS